jgi:hypothetical protein
MGVLEIFLYAGILVPQGYADGFTYSIKSRQICQQKIAAMPESPGKAFVKCIVKVDPGAAPTS